MNEKQVEQREQALSRSGGVCAVCGKPLKYGSPQYAHRIANKEMWRNKYGSFVIDHTKNGEMVCGLSCNQSIDVGSSYGNHLEVIADILIAEYIKMWGVDGLGRLSDLLLKKYKEMGVAVNG